MTLRRSSSVAKFEENRVRSLFLMNLAAIMERADEGLLPAVYAEIGVAFSATPSQLGWLTFIRALVQALSSPLAGILSMYYDRAQVVGVGTLFWSISTIAVGLSRTYWQCAIWRAVNGIGLAIVIPALQSFIADSYPDESRGVAFGWLNLVGSFGSIVGSTSATIIADYKSIFGIAGWRFAFLAAGVISAFIGWAVCTFAVDPRTTSRQIGSMAIESPSILSSSTKSLTSHWWKDTWSGVKTVLAVPTFQVIVLQGLIGSIPWQAMVFFTMWLQLVGFDHYSTAKLMGLFSIGCAAGTLFGGWLGDEASKKFPDTGRIMCAQLSAFLGVPFCYVLLAYLPANSSWFFAYGITFLLGGLTISWCQAGTNNPIFAEVVPPNLRTAVYALDRAFEGALAALAVPAVGILAESFFGYDTAVKIPVGGLKSAAVALAKGLFACMAIPFGLCSLCYGLLYYTYSSDRDRITSRLS